MGSPLFVVLLAMHENSPVLSSPVPGDSHLTSCSGTI